MDHEMARRRSLCTLIRCRTCISFDRASCSLWYGHDANCAWSLRASCSPWDGQEASCGL